MNILILSTSPRHGSLTFRFSTYLKQEIQKQFPESQPGLINFAEFDISPFGKGSFPSNPISPFQEKLIGLWESADLIFFCSPEYNWTASAETFILLERLGGRAYINFFQNKVFALAGVSSGRGGRQPALDMGRVLSKIIGFLGTESVVSPKILEVHEVGGNLDENGKSAGHPSFEGSVSSFVEYSLKMAKRWKYSKSID
jgi:chromate reductase